MGATQLEEGGATADEQADITFFEIIEGSTKKSEKSEAPLKMETEKTPLAAMFWRHVLVDTHPRT